MREWERKTRSAIGRRRAFRPYREVITKGSIATKVDCARLVELYELHKHCARVMDYSGFPMVHYSEVGFEGKQLLLSIGDKILSRVREWFGETFVEWIGVAGLGVGGYHTPHADNAKLAEDGRTWVPNHTPQRSFSSLLYLNRDFEGGDLQFINPRSGKVLRSIRPTTGLLVAFPSTKDFVHQVTPVTSGVRYSMPVWFTQDPNLEVTKRYA